MPQLFLGILGEISAFRVKVLFLNQCPSNYIKNHPWQHSPIKFRLQTQQAVLVSISIAIVDAHPHFAHLAPHFSPL